MKTLNDLIELVEGAELYKQSRVKRWQQRDYIHEENDSEHQLFVTQIIVMLSFSLNIDKDVELLALRYGATHDYVESCSGVGDVNFMVKQRNPELKKIVESLEKAAMQTVPAFYRAMKECEKNKLASKLVDLADSLDVILYARRESKSMKDNKIWEQIIEEGWPRTKQLLEEVIERNRKYKTTKKEEAEEEKIIEIDILTKVINEFSSKYGFDERPIDEDLINHRFYLVTEEYAELVTAFNKQNAEEIVDAIIDLMWNLRMLLKVSNVDFEKALNEVARANMSKKLGYNNKRKESCSYDLIKPEGWVPPDHTGNHGVLDIVWN